MEISDDELFNRALPVFRKQFENLVRNRSDELRDRIHEEASAKVPLGRIVDSLPYHPILWRDHAKNIGEDFLKTFDDVVKPYCGNISATSRSVLYKILYEIYEGLIHRREREFSQALAATGQPQRTVSSARAIYATSQSKYRNILDEKILKHNLDVDSKKKAVNVIVAEKIENNKKTKKRKSKAEMRVIYHSVALFWGRKRAEYERREDKYGAAKYADEQTVKEIWRKYRVKVSSRNVREAMSRN
jgi:hypothetical protein